MSDEQSPAAPALRGGVRRARTRAALITAAQRFLADGRVTVPIQEITETAGLGTGSFYNHFATKEELFTAAAADALEQHGALLDLLTADLDDAAAVFTTSFRITGRLNRRAPELARVLLGGGPGLIEAPSGLGPRARRDLQAGVAAGRFTVDDLDVAMLIVGGATITLAQRILDHDDVDDAVLTDSVAAALLRLLGVDAEEAQRLSTAALPDLDSFTAALDAHRSSPA